MTTTPADLLASLIAQAPSLDQEIRCHVEPIRLDRERIRQHFQDQGKISQYDPTLNTLSVGAADGASAMTQTLIGDAMSCVSLSALNGKGGLRVIDHRQWSTFLPHAQHNKPLLTAMMMTYEQALLHAIPEGNVKIIDGAHVTPLIAIAVGLAIRDDDARETLVQTSLDEDIPQIVSDLSRDPLVVACPKSDSSIDLWKECENALGLKGHPLPDKVLASLILDQGEVLTTTRKTPATWRVLFSNLGKVHDARAKVIASKIDQSIRPLYEADLTVCHAKPAGAPTAIRMEFHPEAAFDQQEMVASVCSSVHAPHVKEPLTQHIADVFAKSVSPLAEVQMERTRLALAEMGALDYLQYLTNYRTN